MALDGPIVRFIHLINIGFIELHSEMCADVTEFRESNSFASIPVAREEAIEDNILTVSCRFVRLGCFGKVVCARLNVSVHVRRVMTQVESDALCCFLRSEGDRACGTEQLTRHDIVSRCIVCEC